MATPIYQSAAAYVGEDFVTLSFDVPLDATHPPQTSAFAILLNGTTSVPVTSVVVDGTAKTVKIGFSSHTLSANDVVTYTYTDPTNGDDIDAIQGTDGADASGVSASTTATTTRPTLLFTSINLRNLYYTDGTVNGTHFLAGASTSPIFKLDPLYSKVSTAIVGTTTYFTMADTTGNTSAIWSYDGSALTQITSSSNYVFNLQSTTTTINPDPIFGFGNDLVFSQATLASNASDMATLAIYDPTTHTIIQPMAPNGGYNPHSFVVQGGVLYFEARDSITNAQAIYSYDGSTVTEIYNLHPTYSTGGSPAIVSAAGAVTGPLISFNGNIYFGSGQETVEKLTSLTSLSNSATNVAGAAQYNYNEIPGEDLIVSNNHLFFLASNNGVYSLSTNNVLTQVLGSIGSQEFRPVVYNNAVYFAGRDPNTLTPGLYTSTGGTATLVVSNVTASNLVVMGNTLYFNNGTLGTLGTFDGTTVGTVAVPGNGGAIPLLVAPVSPVSWPAGPPSEFGLTSASDSGYSGDFSTDITTPTLSGTGIAGSTIRLYENSSVIGSTTVASDGTWSIPLGTLGLGSYSYAATQTTGSGPESSPSTLTFSVVAPPTPATPTLDGGSDSGTTGDLHTTETMPTFSGTGTDGDEVDLYDGTNFLDYAIVSDGTWSITVPSPGLSVGPHDITTVVTTTTTGDTATSSVVTVTIDPVPTTPAVTSPALTNVAAPTLTGSADTGDTVTVTVAGATYTTTASNGGWTINLATATPASGSLSLNTNGDNAVSVSAVDAYGNPATSTGAQTLTIDTTAPTTTISGIAISDDSNITTDFITNVASQTVTATLSAALSGGDVLLGSVDGGTTWTDISSSVTGTSLSWVGVTLAGASSIRLKVADLAGNDGEVASQAYTLDTTAPAAPSPAPALDALSDTGASSSDDITNATTPTITGTAEPGSLVTLYWDLGIAQLPLGSAVADDSGNYSIVSASLTDGIQTLYVTATDAAGNVSTASTALTVTIDTTAPSAPGTPVLTAASDSGVSSSDHITNVTAPAITGTTEAGGLVTLYDTDGTTVLGTGTANGSGHYSIVASTLTEGVHTLTVTTIDVAGNASTASPALSVTIDITAPSAPTTLILNTASDSGASNSDRITSVKIPTVHGTASAGILVKLYDTDGTTVLGSATANGSGNYSITSSTLSDGVHSLTVKALDAAGNASTASSSLSVTIDSTAPADPDAPVLDPASDSGALDGHRTNVVMPTITGTIEAGSLVTLYDTDGTTPLGSTTADGSGNYTIVTSTLSEGNHTIRVTATDVAGNVSNPSLPIGLVIDTTAPVTPGAPVLFAGSDSGVSSSDGITNVMVPTFTGTVEAGSLVTLYDTDGTTILGTTAADGSGQYNLSVVVSQGTHTLTVKATDAAGNVSSRSSALSVTIDTTAPAAPSAAPVLDSGSDGGMQGDNLTNVTTPTITGTAAPDSIVKLYDTDGTTVLGSATADGSGHYSIVSDTLTEGTHTLTVKVVDLAGNASTASPPLSLTIDVTAPSAPSPAPVLDPGSDSGAPSDGITNVTTPTITGSGAVADSLVTLYDTDGTTVLGSTTADGSGNYSIISSTLTEGVHTLTVTTTDAAGNASTASSALSVTVDTTAPAAPVITSPDLTNSTTPVLSGTAETDDTITVTIGGATYTTVASGGTWSIDLATAIPALGTLSLILNGPNAVSASAVDPAGNPAASSGTQTLTIDTVAPTTTLSAIDISSDSNIDGDFVTNVASQTITATLSTPLVSGEILRGSVDGGTTWTDITSFVSGTEVSWTGVTLIAGASSIRLEVADLAGNDGPVASQTYTLATTGPGITLSGIGISADSNITTDFVTNVASQTITATLSAALAGGDIVQGSVDGGSTWKTLRASSAAPR